MTSANSCIHSFSVRIEENCRTSTRTSRLNSAPRLSWNMFRQELRLQWATICLRRWSTSSPNTMARLSSSSSTTRRPPSRRTCLPTHSGTRDPSHTQGSPPLSFSLTESRLRRVHLRVLTNLRWKGSSRRSSTLVSPTASLRSHSSLWVRSKPSRTTSSRPSFRSTMFAMHI